MHFRYFLRVRSGLLEARRRVMHRARRLVSAAAGLPDGQGERVAAAAGASSCWRSDRAPHLPCPAPPGMLAWFVMDGTPQFAQPPVVELALSTQFKPLPGLTLAHLGLLWERLRSEYPQVEHHPPLQRTIETFSEQAHALKRSLDVMVEFPEPRLWFVSEEGTELLQVQRDRLAQNWRRRTDNEYPSYTELRDSFSRRLEQHAEFLQQEAIGPVEFDQCEITYVDHIPLGDEPGCPRTHGQLGRVFTFWDPVFSAPGLDEPETARCSLSFVLRDSSGEPAGRVHLAVAPAISRLHGERVFEVRTTGRGSPLGDGPAGVLRFLDLAHASVVRLFLSVVRPELQGRWEDRP